MASLTFAVEIAYNRFFEIADNLQSEADAIAKETAAAIIAGYRQRAREDTGAQKASAYLVTANESGYSDAVGAARSKNPQAEMLPEVAPTDPHDVLVAVAAAYAFVNEYGGHGRAGDGAFTQAAEEQRQAHNERMDQLIERAARR